MLYSYILLQIKDTKQNQQKKKSTWSEVRENQTQDSKHPLSVELHRTHSIPPAVTCEKGKSLSAGEALQRVKAQGFYWGLVTWALSVQHVSEFQKPGRKACVQHEPPFLYKLQSHSEALLSVQEHSCNPLAQKPAEHPPLHAGLSKDSVSGLLC